MIERHREKMEAKLIISQFEAGKVAMLLLGFCWPINGVLI
jgi:hypothetical protein